MSTTPPSATEAPPLILIVDDDRNSRESLRRALSRDGYRILVAEDGKVALAMAREEEIDLVLTDLIMPGLGGLAFLEGLRVIRPDVPAILISAFAVDVAQHNALLVVPAAVQALSQIGAMLQVIL